MKACPLDFLPYRFFSLSGKYKLATSLVGRTDPMMSTQQSGVALSAINFHNNPLALSAQFPGNSFWDRPPFSGDE